MRGKSGTVVCIVSSFLNSHACRQLHKMLLCLRVCALLREQLKSPTTERVGEGWRCKSQSSPDGENHLLGAGLCFYVALVHVKEIWLINAALCLWTSFELIDSGSHFQKMDQEFAMKPHQMQLVCGNKNSVLVLLSQTFICLLLVLDLSLQKTYCQILKYTLNGVTKLFFLYRSILSAYIIIKPYNLPEPRSAVYGGLVPLHQYMWKTHVHHRFIVFNLLNDGCFDFRGIGHAFSYESVM